jgi:hypothetical protein
MRGLAWGLQAQLWLPDENPHRNIGADPQRVGDSGYWSEEDASLTVSSHATSLASVASA